MTSIEWGRMNHHWTFKELVRIRYDDWIYTAQKDTGDTEEAAAHVFKFLDTHKRQAA